MEAIAVILSAAELKSSHAFSASVFSWMHQEGRSQLWFTQREWKQQEGAALQEIAKDIMDLCVPGVCVRELLMPWKLCKMLILNLNLGERQPWLGHGLKRHWRVPRAVVFTNVWMKSASRWLIWLSDCKDRRTRRKTSETASSAASCTPPFCPACVCLVCWGGVWRLMEAMN